MRFAVVVVVVSACSFEHGSLSPGDGGAGMDVRSDVMTVDVPPGVWTVPVDIGISSGLGDDDPSLPDDMLELYFGSRRPAASQSDDENLWMVKRGSINDPWSAPVEVTELNTPNAETTAKITGDGLTIFFASDRSSSDADIFMSTRANRTSTWTTPVPVNQLNSSDGDYAAFVSSTLTHVVMCSGPSTPAEALWTSDRSSASASWPVPVRVAELDDANVSEGDPMEPTAGVMYYDSWRLNADKTYDIYRVERSSPAQPWGNRTKVEGINVDAHHDRDPWVSSDEHTMFFSSTRTGGVDKIYMSTR
jgi:hypothetical protein